MAIVVAMVQQQRGSGSEGAVNVPVGPTRVAQRQDAIDTLNRSTVMDKHNNNVASITETDRRPKEATIIGMKGAAIKQRVTTMATSVTMIEKQIEMLEKTKTVLVRSWGEAKYNEKISELSGKMLDDCKMIGDDLVEDNTVGDIDNLQFI